MSEQTEKLLSTSQTYKDNAVKWRYFLNSYLGGDAYMKGEYLTKYVDEPDPEYTDRINSTHLDNHCNSIVSVYNSFLFRSPPIRTFGQIKGLPETDAFLKDANLEGQSLDSFMKDVATWSAVFGSCWIIVAKPNINAGTRAEELAQEVRPYVSLLTPLNVLDWQWVRQANGVYTLDYIKYIEERSKNITTLKEWTNDIINTYVIDTEEEEVVDTYNEVNGLGRIPAVQSFANRSTSRDTGVSDINDIANTQKAIYNNNSEIEQSIRISSHQTLVKPEGTEANAGAGAVINIPDDMDPGLKPYLLQTSGSDIINILKANEENVKSIDKMANTGAVRTSETAQLSGIAMQTEFQLLNARLSAKANILQWTEENMWRLFADYQDKAWDGEILYADSFNIQDTANEILQLKEAKTITTNQTIINEIDKKLAELLDLDLPDDIFNITEEEVPPTTNAITESVTPTAMMSEVIN